MKNRSGTFRIGITKLDKECAKDMILGCFPNSIGCLGIITKNLLTLYNDIPPLILFGQFLLACKVKVELPVQQVSFCHSLVSGWNVRNKPIVCKEYANIVQDANKIHVPTLPFMVFYVK